MHRPPKRRPDTRRIKTKRSYTVDEAARICRVSKPTVRRWIENGLPAIKDKKPHLILGQDLHAFLKARAARKSRCNDDEIYCVKCRAPRYLAGAMVDFIPMSETGGNLRGQCEVCGTEIYRRCSYRQLGGFGPHWDITIMQAPSHLIERARACLNDNL